MAPRPRLLPRVALALLATAMTLGLLEVALRIKAHRDDRAREASWRKVREAPPPPEGSAVGLGQSIRISANPRIVYELIPNLRVQFRGLPLETDARGFRKLPPTPAPPEAPTVRIVGLGDSFMFGWDVTAEQSYLARLSALLHEQHPGRAWDVVNTAVPGYNTVMEAAAFEEKAATPPPDLLLLHFVVNDLDLPNFIVRRASPFSLRRSFLRDYCSKGHGLRFRGTERLARVPGELRDESRRRAEEVPPEYRDMVGLEPFLNALASLHHQATAAGYPVWVLCDLTAPQFLREACAARGLHLVESRSAVDAHLAAGGMTDYLQSDLVQSPTDTHPSAIGHALLAEVLYTQLRATGMLAAWEGAAAGEMVP